MGCVGLEQYPTNSYTDANFWQNEDNVRAALNLGYNQCWSWDYYFSNNKDYVLNISYLSQNYLFHNEYNYISLKNFNNKSNILTTINKMLYGWIKSNEL